MGARPAEPALFFCFDVSLCIHISISARAIAFRIAFAHPLMAKTNPLMAKTKGMLRRAEVKEEMHTPKRMCLNTGLMPPKEEELNSPVPADPALSPLSDEASKLLSGEKPPAESAQGPLHKKCWDKFRVKPGRLAISLSSPSEPRTGTGAKRAAAPLDDRERRRPPPPQLPADLATGTAQHNLLGGGTVTQGRPPVRRGANETKRINNAYNQQKNIWTRTG